MKYFLYLVFVVLLVISPALSHAGHDHDHEEENPNSDVVVLTDDTFEATIENNEYVFAEFYAPWCGHCKHLAPEYEIVATTFKTAGSPVVIAKVDSTQNPGISTKYGVRGYPTLKFFRNGKPLDYDGGRTSGDIINWITKKSGPPTTHITSQEALDLFISQPGIKIIGYLSEAIVPNWVTAASSEKLDDFGLAHVTDSALFGDNAVDTAVIVKPGEDKVVYSGTIDSESLVSFAQTEGFPLVDELAQKVWQRSSTSGTPLLAVFVSAVDETSNALAKEIATKFKGKVITTLSAAASLAERWGCSGKFLPTGILIQWNEQQPKMQIYDEESEPFTAASAETFIEQGLAGTYRGYRKSEAIPETNDGPVKIVVHKNFDDIVLDTEKDVFVEFYAPWCGHCKNLAPIWEELGTAFDDVNTVTIAKCDATANYTPESLNIKGFPTLIFFPADNKAGIPYEGERELNSMREFVVQHASRSIDKEEL